MVFPLGFDYKFHLTGNFQTGMDAHAVVQDVASFIVQLYFKQGVHGFFNPAIHKAMDRGGKQGAFFFSCPHLKGILRVVNSNMDAPFIDPVEQQMAAIIGSKPD